MAPGIITVVCGQVALVGATMVFWVYFSLPNEWPQIYPSSRSFWSSEIRIWDVKHDTGDTGTVWGGVGVGVG